MVGLAEIVFALVAVLILVPSSFKVRFEFADATPVMLILPPTATFIGSTHGMYLGSNGGRFRRTAYSALLYTGRYISLTSELTCFNEPVAFLKMTVTFFMISPAGTPKNERILVMVY